MSLLVVKGNGVSKHYEEMISVLSSLALLPRVYFGQFSNLLIIHEEKTKEISTVKEVWNCVILIIIKFDELLL